MFDEQPDGDPHGECAADIHRLTEENKTLRDTLRGIAESDWRKWDEEVRSPYEFVKWAKSRAQHTLVAIGAYSDGMTEADDMRFIERQSDELRRADFEAEMRLDAFGPKHG